MRKTTSKALAEGLGTLRVLASIGPTTTRALALHTRLDHEVAEALIAVFVETGYVQRIDGSLVTVEPLALAILSLCAGDAGWQSPFRSGATEARLGAYA